MSIPFVCPHCAAPLRIEDSLAGKKARCRSCEKVLIAPLEGRENGFKIIEREPEAETIPLLLRSSSPQGKNRRTLAIGLGLGIILLAFFISGTIALLSKFKPKPRPLNATVLEVMRSYPTDGSYGYWWPKESSWEGTTQDLVYEGQTICSGDPQRRSYCCGLTYEVFFRAHQKECTDQRRPFRIADFHSADLRELRLRWFGDSQTGDRRKLVQEALVSMNLGQAVSRLEEARAGDFVQFWRHNGSGHSALFLEWVWEGGAIVGIKYWSSQGSTNGIGYRTERIGTTDGVKREEIYLARATIP